MFKKNELVAGGARWSRVGQAPPEARVPGFSKKLGYAGLAPHRLIQEFLLACCSVGLHPGKCCPGGMFRGRNVLFYSPGTKSCSGFMAVRFGSQTPWVGILSPTVNEEAWEDGGKATWESYPTSLCLSFLICKVGLGLLSQAPMARAQCQHRQCLAGGEALTRITSSCRVMWGNDH